MLLADRVLVMSAGPDGSNTDIAIDLPRPRDVSSPEFNAVRRDVARRLDQSYFAYTYPGVTAVDRRIDHPWQRDRSCRFTGA